MAGPRRFNRRQKRNPHRTNNEIRVPEIRLVGDNVDNGIYTPQEALRMADQQELDLVEISPKADPPVCKIMDYQKFLYQQKKKQKEIKSKTQKVTLKELRFSPHTDDHDFNFKLNHAKKFLEDGSKVKAYVFFKGRTIAYKEQGELLLLRLAQELEGLGKVEQMPKLEGKRMIMMLAPSTQKK